MKQNAYICKPHTGVGKSVVFSNTAAQLAVKFITNIFIAVMEKVLLFEFGTEGGGAEVYKLPDNRVLEMGSSGGMLNDEEEDPVRSWEVMFVDFEHWWKHFITQNGSFWIYFYPIFMHDEVKPIIRSSVEQYISEKGDEAGHHSEEWVHCLNSGNNQ